MEALHRRFASSHFAHSKRTARESIDQCATCKEVESSRRFDDGVVHTLSS